MAYDVLLRIGDGLGVPPGYGHSIPENTAKSAHARNPGRRTWRRLVTVTEAELAAIERWTGPIRTDTATDCNNADDEARYFGTTLAWMANDDTHPLHTHRRAMSSVPLQRHHRLQWILGIVLNSGRPSKGVGVVRPTCRRGGSARSDEVRTLTATAMTKSSKVMACPGRVFLGAGVVPAG